MLFFLFLGHWVIRFLIFRPSVPIFFIFRPLDHTVCFVVRCYAMLCYVMLCHVM